MDSIVWAENTPPAAKAWVTGLFSAADTRGEEAGRKFADHFASDGVLVGMAGPVQGPEAIYQSRLKVFDTAKSRRHVVSKVFTLNQNFSEIMITGVLESTLTNGRSFEMGFAAQVVFSKPLNDTLKAAHYQLWADTKIATEAASAALATS